MADDPFLLKYAPLANSIATRTGLDPSVVLGIVDIETGHGNRVLGNNIFGISPSGPNGQYVAQYPHVEAASEAFINLMNSPGYAAVAKATTPAAQVQALVRSRYNTVNPNYAAIVTRNATNIGRQLGYQDTEAPAPAAPVAPAAAAPPAPAPAAGSALDRIDQRIDQRAQQQTTGPASATPPAATAPGGGGGSALDRLDRRIDQRVQQQTTPDSTTTQKTEQPPSAAPTVNMDEYGRELGPGGLPVGDSPLGPSPGTAAKVLETLKSDEGIRNALEPAPNTTYGSMPWMPFAKDDKTGEIRLALPSSLRDMARGIYDMTQGPATGGMTPEGTNALAGIMMGGAYPSVARGTGVAIGSRALPPGSVGLGRKEVPDLLGPEFRAAPAVSDNALAPTSIGPSEPNPSMQPPGPVEKLLFGTKYANPPPRGPGVEPPAPAAEPPASAQPGMGAASDDATFVRGIKGRVDEVKRANAEAHAQDLGAAATPEEQARITARQAQTARRVAEIDAVAAPPEPGDTTEWVKGSRPTRAQYTGTATESQAERVVREHNPDRFTAQDAENTTARVDAYDEVAGSRHQFDELEVAQEAQAKKDEAMVLARSKPGEWHQELADWVDAQLADPRISERDRVRTTLQDLQKKLRDADGNLKTDPRSVWGINAHIRDELKVAKDATTAQAYAKEQLTQAKLLSDAGMNRMSDGAFQTFNENWANYAKKMNAIELLQDFRDKGLFKKAGGTITIDANRFHKFVLDLAIKRGSHKLDPAQDIPDTVFQRLVHINNDMKRDALIDLGKSRGSPTHIYGEVARALGIAGAHAVTGLLTAGTGAGGFANLMVKGATDRAGGLLGGWRMNRLTNRALADPPGGLRPNPVNRPD